MQHVTCVITIRTIASYISFEYIVSVTHHVHRDMENALSRVKGTFRNRVKRFTLKSPKYSL